MTFCNIIFIALRIKAAACIALLSKAAHFIGCLQAEQQWPQPCCIVRDYKKSWKKQRNGVEEKASGQKEKEGSATSTAQQIKPHGPAH